MCIHCTFIINAEQNGTFMIALDVNEWLNESFRAQLTSKRAVLFALIPVQWILNFLGKTSFSSHHNSRLLPPYIFVIRLAFFFFFFFPHCRWMKDPAFDWNGIFHYWASFCWMSHRGGRSLAEAAGTRGLPGAGCKARLHSQKRWLAR